MHEFGIVQQLVSLAEDELANRNCTAKVKSLSIRVGTLSGASPEALKFSFEGIASSTGLKDARLVITESKPLCACRNCGRVQLVEEFLFACPSCGR